MYFLSTLKAEAADEAVLEDLTVGMEHVIQTKNVVALMIVVKVMDLVMVILVHLIVVMDIVIPIQKHVNALTIVAQKKVSPHVTLVVMATVTQMKITVAVSMTVMPIQKYVHEIQILLSKIVVQVLRGSVECVYLLHLPHHEHRELLRIHAVSQKHLVQDPITIYL